MRRAVVLLAFLLAGCGSTRTVTVLRTHNVTARTPAQRTAPLPSRAAGIEFLDLPLASLVPADAQVEGVWHLGGRPPELALTYARTPIPGSTFARRGLAVWRFVSTNGGWRRIGLMERMAYAFHVRTADVNGDGRQDVLVFQDEGGSGGWGTWRLLVPDGRHVRKVWARYASTDTAWAAVARLRLVVFDAVGSSKDPKTDGYIHCCWLRWRRAIYVWDGRRLVVAARTVGRPPRRDFH